MSTPTSVITYPIPLYQNVPIQAYFYQPNQFFISNITLGTTTVITTTINHNYVIGQIIRLVVPKYSGTFELNEKQGVVISIPSNNQVEVNINSQNMTPFVSTTAPTQPQITAIGNLNSGASNPQLPTSTFIPGSFINISPI